MKKETKSFGFEVKAISEEGNFEGYASTFGNVDFGGDIVAKGAFAQSIKVNKGIVPILASHNPDHQIGWNKSAFEDNKGLKVEGMLDFNVQKAVERHSLMKTAKELGAKMGLSIGYRVIKAEPHRSKVDVRVLREVELMEYSVVTFPMNAKATVTAVKTIDGVNIDELQEHLINDKGISHKAASMACDMLRSFGASEQGYIDHSPDEGLNELKKSMQKVLSIFKTN